MGIFTYAGEALILIALGIGYIVIYLARREEKQMQLLGYTVGAVIIALSVVYLAANVWIHGKAGCFQKPFHKNMMFHDGRQLPDVPPAPAPAP